jgi:hypothetical protein
LSRWGKEKGKGERVRVDQLLLMGWTARRNKEKKKR